MAVVGTVSPAASLYRDALHSIFKFLKLEEFVRTCVISKSWYLSGQQMRTRKDRLNYDRPVCLLVQSPLRHHICALDLLLLHTDPNGLFLLQYFMDHLEELYLRIIIKLNENDLNQYSALSRRIYTSHRSVSDCFTIPRQLNVLSIEFHFMGDDWGDIGSEEGRMYLSGCLQQIALQSTRLVKLRLELNGASCELDYAQIQALQSITTLTEIELPKELPLNPQIDLIKSMPPIRRWIPSFGGRSIRTKEIQRLVDGPTGPPLLEDLGTLMAGDLDDLDEDDLPIPVVVDDAMAEQLKRLVTLKKLDIKSMSLTDPTKLLPHFPRLSTLFLKCEESVDLNHLATALTTCVSLTELYLKHKELTSSNVDQFLPYLTSLVILIFDECVGLTSLEFLDTAHASLGNLTHFSICDSTQMPITEYRHLRAISSSLEELTIDHSANGRFDSLTIGRWTPGSKEFNCEEWPKLKSFVLSQLPPS